ncbi:MAG: M24 family metallopeptidase [Flavobacteriaceae bacterium]|nr:aminopeptidase P N-terminal domain-containing protein [Bacteroidia bacterium]MBT8288095.1 aminopeptidase P N-terminal domain-containing protein [Bacteroidia bacterium]NNF73873.1 M24 family metallopeptidase [Flavobacteriaceae bacterium]NNK74271.1 M24 family metallopeptidase [Flavobacteriaceae bacterium]
MKLRLIIILFLTSIGLAWSQENTPTDFLDSEFHKERRAAFREKMPKNTVAVFFANPVRNRSNDVDYVYHQDPDFYYLTGLREPHAALIIYSEEQKNESGENFYEQLYVQRRNPRMEQWTGYRLGPEGARGKLGFKQAFNGADFLKNDFNFAEFDEVWHKPIVEDVRKQRYNRADLYSIIQNFKSRVTTTSASISSEDSALDVELKKGKSIGEKSVNTNTKSIRRVMAELRQIKTPKEMSLLKKAVRISAQGQIEVMKAMKPNMSETEIQGIHEYVYKKYGSEYEGYPSIVGAGNNGCVLHYMENNKMTVNDELVLMDLGAEYHGYTADVTRTIPADGTFSREQKAIYDLVYLAQEAGINAARVGRPFNDTDKEARRVIVKGLVELGIAKDEKDARQYFPHGTSHYIGLDVHDAGLYAAHQPNMVITVEPGIYIPKGSPCDEKWHGIAVRIEDDILITENGPVNLSAEAPRTSEAIEAMMKRKSALDDFKLPKLD